MEVRLVKGIKDGRDYEKVFVNNKSVDKYIASRMLTNTDNESGTGVFGDSDEIFSKGDQKRSFAFEPIIGEFATTEYVNGLKKRIAEVREWVNGLNYEHSISFSVQDP